jgi:hypothetical protein
VYQRRVCCGSGIVSYVIPDHLAKFDWYGPHLAWLGYDVDFAPEQADLRGAILRGADLIGVDLSWAILSGVDLRGADLRWADLSWADLSWADLSGVDLRWANLSGALGSIAFGPTPGLGRTGFAVLHGSDIYIKLGCWWDTLENTLNKLRADRTLEYVEMVEKAATALREGLA